MKSSRVGRMERGLGCDEMSSKENVSNESVGIPL